MAARPDRRRSTAGRSGCRQGRQSVHGRSAEPPRAQGVGRGQISTVAGTGQPANAVEGLAPTSTPLVAPEGLLADPAGVLWIAEYFGNRVRQLTPGGTILTVAGNGTAGFSGDTRQARARNCRRPGRSRSTRREPVHRRFRKSPHPQSNRGNHQHLCRNRKRGLQRGWRPGRFRPIRAPRDRLRNAGNLYIADTGNNRVRKVTPGGQITTVARRGRVPVEPAPIGGRGSGPESLYRRHRQSSHREALGFGRRHRSSRTRRRGIRRGWRRRAGGPVQQPGGDADRLERESYTSPTSTTTSSES